ncbi:MAG: hypothetical protein ABIT01_01695 [Thermoanaerobaculia bacterium]
MKRGGPDSLRQRAVTAADLSCTNAVELLSRSSYGAPRELRRQANATNLDPFFAHGSVSKRAGAGAGLVVERLPARFAALSRPSGTDLRVFNQEGFFTERHIVGAVVMAKALRAPVRVEVELESIVSDAPEAPSPRVPQR